jgi:propanol-preferring alcohol dehydrogenase
MPVIPETIPETMRAAVVREFGKPLTIEQWPVPKPGRGEVLVKIVATGVCHTDLHAAHGDWPVQPTLPFIPGHEGVGHVAALGEGVEDLALGDPVGVPWLFDACGHCEFCLTGWETLCEKQHNTGYSVNGTYAEYVVAPAAFVGRLPKGITEAQMVPMAPILCAGVTTYKGLKETEARPGQWVAISGVGGLGHVAVQYAKAMGLKVVGVDVGQDKLDLALELGADLAVNALEEGAAARIVEATGGGVHGVLVTAVSVPAFAQALAMVRRRGTVALVGLPPGAFPTPIFDVVLKRITVRGSIVGTRSDLAEAIAFAAEGKVKTTVATQPLEAINDVFDRMIAGTIEGRIVLTL